MLQRVTLNQGAQTIALVPTSPLDGVGFLAATGASAQIFDLTGSGTSQAPVACTLDSVLANRVTSAPAGRGTEDARSIEFASTANLVAGRYYGLVSTDGTVVTTVRIKTIASATQVITYADIRGSFLAGSALHGVTVYFDVGADVADDKASLGALLVEWSVTHAGGVEVYREALTVEASHRAGIAAATDVARLDPEAVTLNQRGNKVESALEQAHIDFWRILQAQGVDPDGYNPGPSGSAWVVRRACELLRRTMSGEGDMEIAFEYRTECKGIMANMTQGTGVLIATPDEDPKKLTDIEGVYDVWSIT